MKKYFTLILVSICASSLFAQEIDLREEFKFDQEQSLNEFVDAWIKANETQRDLLKRFTYLVRANNRYRQTLTGPDSSLVGEMIRAAGDKSAETAAQKMNLAMMAYFKSKGIVIDTRSCFSAPVYEVKR